MAEGRSDRVEALFHRAADLPPEGQRALLDSACAGDPALRAELERLLADDARLRAGGGATAFLDSPLVRSPPPAAPAGPALTPRLGRYRVLRLLGEGGMASVYEAEQDNPRRAVALKVIRPGLLSPVLLKRFAQEAQILGRLSHPGIGRIYEAGVAEDGQPFFALELVRGLALDEYTRQHGLDLATRLDLLARVCDAVQHAHEQGVIHRDLKPSNVLVDGSRQPKVLDFGVARAADADLLGTAARTRTGHVVGTLGYMSPEQVAGDPKLDARSDVYALGVILYEVLAGRLPYPLEGLPLPEAARLIREHEPARLGSLDARLRGDVETIAAKALEKDPGRRYPSAGELAADLRRHLRHEPIRARPTSALYQLRKFARRHKALVGGSAGVLAALLVGLVGTTLFAAREARQRARAEHNAGVADDERRAALYQGYHARLAAAASALQLHNIDVARELLEAAPEEHRKWEWYHFHSQLDNARSVLRGHRGECWDVEFSPDGRRVVSCSADNTVRVWNTATGQALATLRGPGANFHVLRLNRDGTLVAAGTEDGVHCVWEAATGKALAVLRGSPGTTALAWGPDGQSLAYALSPDRAVHVWDATTRRPALLGRGHTDVVSNVCFSPDGRYLASCGEDRTVRVWEVATRRLLTVLRGHTARVLGLAFSPDGKRLVSSASYPDNTARLWDLRTGEVTAVLAGHRNAVYPVVFSADGRRIATASLDQTARLWDGTTGKVLATLAGHTGAVQNICFNAQGTRVVTASDDQTLRVWDAATGSFLALLRGHGAAVRGVAYSRDGALVASASHDGTVRLWDPALVERDGVLRGHRGFVYDVAFSPDGGRVASAAWDGTARLWDAGTGRQTRLFRHEADIVSSVAWSRDGRSLATVSRDDHVHVWDAATGTRRHRLGLPTGYWVTETRAAFNPAGTRLAAGSRDGRVRLWEAATGKVAADLRGHDGCVSDVAFSPDSSGLASADEKGVVRLWDAESLEPVAVLRGHTGVVFRVAYSADGRLLATASRDKTVRLWVVQTHDLLAVFRHGSIVYGVGFNRDGSRLASACGDNTIRLWDIDRQEEVAQLRGHGDYVHAVAFSPDGLRLVSGSGDRTVRVWETEPPRLRQGRAGR
jgi:eukaryotic-like serine/threonine-protein kinase